MYLAIGKNGKLGRQIGSCGIEAITAPAAPASYSSNVQVSEKSILADNLYYKALDAKKAADAELREKQRCLNEMGEYLSLKDKMKKMKPFQDQASYAENKRNRQLYRHFFQQMGSAESARVAQSVTADFNRNEMVESGGVMRPIVRRADFDMMELVGNPLTRNGQYGVVTDWDLLVKGNELDNARIVGGTMLGRYNGQDIPYRREGKAARRKKKMMGRCSMGRRGMGDDDSPFDPGDLDVPSQDVYTEPNIVGQPYVDPLPPDYTNPEQYQPPVYSIPMPPVGATPTPPESTTPEEVDDEHEPTWWERVGLGLSTGAAQGAQAGAAGAVANALNPHPSGATAAQIAAAQAAMPGAALARSMGIPLYALYAILGVGAIGVGLMVFKASKSSKAPE